MFFSYYTTVNWEENRELWVHGFQIHGKFLVPKKVNWEVTLYYTYMIGISNVMATFFYIFVVTYSL